MAQQLRALSFLANRNGTKVTTYTGIYLQESNTSNGNDGKYLDGSRVHFFFEMLDGKFMAKPMELKEYELEIVAITWGNHLGLLFLQTERD